MDLQHIAFKIFVDGDLKADWEQFINVFHGWVAAQSMPEMMIDVADYRHVPNGPGVVMVGHQADYYMDNTDGRPGLRYVCKVQQDGSNSDRVQSALKAALAAAERLETEIPDLKLSRTEFELTINDRGCAPNNADTQSVLESELPGLLKEALGADVSITVEQDARKLAGAAVTANAPISFTAA